MDQIERMLGHDQWATTQLLDKSRGLTDAQLDQPFDIGQGTLRDTFRHMCDARDFWTAQMAGQPLPDNHPRRPALAALLDEQARSMAAFAAVARLARDEQRLDATFVDHAGNQQSLGGTLYHVILHNAQHRAEARHMLERLGVPELWDYDPQEWEYVARSQSEQSEVQRQEA
jgi:uncharacterized damage-inducible protein DinB